jgi:hypothetical protein
VCVAGVLDSLLSTRSARGSAAVAPFEYFPFYGACTNAFGAGVFDVAASIVAVPDLRLASFVTTPAPIRRLVLPTIFLLGMCPC